MATTEAGTQRARELRPFRPSTRQRMQGIGTVPVTIGNQVSMDLPRVGLLNGIILNFAAVLNLTGAGTYTAFGPFGFLKRIRVTLNTGAANIFDCSGYGAWIVNNRMIRSAYFPGSNDLSAATSLNGNNNVYFSLYIPIAMNDELQFAIGLINLQAPEVRATLDLTFASSGTDVVSNFNTIVGTVNASYVYYEVPDPRTTMFPPLVLHRILEERQAITATGDQVYTFPRGGTLLQLLHNVTLNGAIADLRQGLANSNSIDSVRMVLNKTDTLYNLNGRAMALWQALNQAGQNGVGQAIDWNFLDAGVTRTGEGDFRDTIDSELLSTLESIVTINAGAVLGPANYLDSIRRIFQVLQA